MIYRFWPAGVLLLSLVASGCASAPASPPPCPTVTPGAEIPAIPSYSEDYRMKFANEVDVICGDPKVGTEAKFPYSCTFIEDSIKLRAAIKAIKG